MRTNMPPRLAISPFNLPSLFSRPERTNAHRIALLIGVFSVAWMLWTRPAQATTIEWANVGSTWAAGSNWVGGTAPADSTVTDIASFGSTGVSPINPNLTAQRNINGIIFLSGAYSYTIGGSIITIGGSGISNSATNTETFSNGIRTSTSQTWTTNSGGTLVLNGTVDMNQNLATTRTLTVNGAGNTTFNATIQNSFAGSTGNLTYSGSGTLTLAGNNTYTGTTTLSGGTTLINGNQSSATGAVSVNNAGTVLGGTGTIGGAVTVNSGANITGATNGTVGTLALSSTLTLSGASGNLAAYLVDISGLTSDKLAISSSLNLSGSFDKIAFTGPADGTTTYVLATYSSVSGTFDTVTGLPSGYQLIYGATELDLAPVPEVSTWLSSALAFAGIGLTQRRRLLRNAKTVPLARTSPRLGEKS
jgi:autotransporter-associated beta strand protein